MSWQMKPSVKQKFVQTLIIGTQLLLLSACASAKDEDFDYSSYEQQASYSAAYYDQQAKECSAVSNIASSDQTIELRGCITASNQFSTGIKVFHSLSAVQKMCIFPAKLENNRLRPMVLMNGNIKVVPKVCGTIVNTGSTSTLNQPGVQGVLVVDAADAVKVSAFSECLKQSDFRTCAQDQNIVFAEGVLN